MDVLHRPILSSDGRFAAIINGAYGIQILSIQNKGGTVDEINRLVLPKSTQSVLAKLSIARLFAGGEQSQEVYEPPSQPSFLLLSDGTRLIVLDTRDSDNQAANGVTNSPIVADYQIGDQFGKLTYADFLLGHDNALLLFEMNTHASILSLTKPQRDDVPNPKFNDSRCVAVSPNKKSLALLVRNKGQDQVIVFSLKDGSISKQVSFNCDTSDAQGIHWSPDYDPVSAVWDSAAHGTKVIFFSALGHALKQLEISTFPGSPTDNQGLGISCFKWIKHDNETLVAIADSNKHVFIRQQHNRTMTTKTYASITHVSTIDGSKCIVWQETPTSEKPFTLQKGAFDAILSPTARPEIDVLEFNSDQNFIVTKTTDNPKTIWIWQPDHPDPHTVITFHGNVTQVLWHPHLPNVLVVITYQKLPQVYVWHTETKPPAICPIPMSNTASTRWEGTWLGALDDGRCPFMLSSSKSFDIGFLKEREEEIRLESLLSRDETFVFDDDEDMTEEIDTPSKSNRNPGRLMRIEKGKEESGLW